MDSYTIFGCTIAIILIMLIFRKLNTSVDEKSGMYMRNKAGDISIISHNGEIHLTKEKFVNILSQFKKNLERAVPYIDPYNSYELQKSTAKAKRALQEWVEKQKDPILVLIKENVVLREENAIENEREQLHKNNISINDLIYNSKKEAGAPVEDEKDYNTTGETQATPEKTRAIINSLANNLQIIITAICDNNKCVLMDTINIKPFEKLMNKIKKFNNVALYTPNYQPLHSLPTENQNFITVGRDNATLMDCYKGECGLTDDSMDSSSMIMEKYRTVNNRFPHVSTKYDNTNLNRFSTIVR